MRDKINPCINVYACLCMYGHGWMILVGLLPEGTLVHRLPGRELN